MVDTYAYDEKTENWAGRGEFKWKREGKKSVSMRETAILFDLPLHIIDVFIIYLQFISTRYMFKMYDNIYNNYQYN